MDKPGEAHPNSMACLPSTSLFGARAEASIGWTTGVAIGVHPEAFPPSPLH
uniref:Uncharacterized protein n=1 Tax=Arundo donax TaxID=35708 RepID=A0A0A9HIB6_ARUDO